MTSTHEDHVRRHNKAVYRVHGDALKPRTCDDCEQTICCMYGQKAIEDVAAPSGVWLLHLECAVPVKATVKR